MELRSSSVQPVNDDQGLDRNYWNQPCSPIQQHRRTDYEAHRGMVREAKRRGDLGLRLRCSNFNDTARTIESGFFARRLPHALRRHRRSHRRRIQIQNPRQLEKFENVAGWERSDSFEAVYGDVEQADPRGEVSEGSIYVPTPKASPAEANYCLFSGEHIGIFYAMNQMRIKTSGSSERFQCI
ncbi:hypothetical protein B9Z55_028007 [Caenorhabditis nigoni]|uniref:Uncharacterized protein n=1 Tax=Caenorhabditis nigoni TaxID=1611254 RepID=A0A2G5SE47_9PELO|nr:hypothetical protein B9Z55_028007 [Caenorhabditis nigoni]